MVLEDNVLTGYDHSKIPCWVSWGGHICFRFLLSCVSPVLGSQNHWVLYSGYCQNQIPPKWVRPTSSNIPTTIFWFTGLLGTGWVFIHTGSIPIWSVSHIIVTQNLTESNGSNMSMVEWPRQVATETVAVSRACRVRTVCRSMVAGWASDRAVLSRDTLLLRLYSTCCIFCWLGGDVSTFGCLESGQALRFGYRSNRLTLELVDSGHFFFHCAYRSRPWPPFIKRFLHYDFIIISL